MSKEFNLREITQMREAYVGDYVSIDEQYEKNRVKLMEIFDAVDFYSDFIKKDGEYCICEKHVDFINWLIDNHTSKNMKCIRSGECWNAEIDFLYHLLHGLEELLNDAEITEEERNLQCEIMQKKTDYHVMVRMKNINTIYCEAMENALKCLSAPTFRLKFEEKCKYLDDVLAHMKEFANQINKDFAQMMREKECVLGEDVWELTEDELLFSGKSTEIANRLYSNEEYVNLMEKVEEIKQKKDFLKNKEKELRKINKRLSAIFNDVIKDYDIKFDELTFVEKLMCLNGDCMTITIKSDGKRYVQFDDPYNWKSLLL